MMSFAGEALGKKPTARREPTVILSPSPTFSASDAAFTRFFLLSMSVKILSSCSMAGIHASETCESMMRAMSGGGKVMDSIRVRRGFSMVYRGNMATLVSSREERKLNERPR